MSVRGNIRLGKCHSGNCPSGKCPFRELSVRGNVHLGTVWIPVVKMNIPAISSSDTGCNSKKFLNECTRCSNIIF